MVSLLQKLRKLRQFDEKDRINQRKQKKWVTWAVKHLQQRGKKAETNLFCGPGNIHLVGPKQTKIGNGQAFKSLACSGCASGRRVLLKFGITFPHPYGYYGEQIVRSVDQKTLKSVQTLPCYLCQEFFIVTRLQVKEGDIIKTTGSISSPETESSVLRRDQFLKDFEPTAYFSVETN
jgi:hypothetical protein